MLDALIDPVVCCIVEGETKVSKLEEICVIIVKLAVRLHNIALLQKL